jgi:hypothetical protein
MSIKAYTERQIYRDCKITHVKLSKTIVCNVLSVIFVIYLHNSHRNDSRNSFE